MKQFIVYVVLLVVTAQCHMPSLQEYCCQVLSTPAGQTTCDNIRRQVEQAICRSYLGMKSGAIPNDAITASSHYPGGHEAYKGRLDYAATGDACWAYNSGQESGAWIQVDLQRTRNVTGVITQGRDSTNNQWMTSYNVKYGMTTGSLKYVATDGNPKVFRGNFDKTTPVTNLFPVPVETRYIRLYPLTWRGNCMRFELIGC